MTSDDPADDAAEGSGDAVDPEASPDAYAATNEDGGIEDGGVDPTPGGETADASILETLGLSITQAWAGTVAALAMVFGLGSVLFPRTVYANFVWHYFWGPVYADAQGWQYAAWANGNVERASGPESEVARELWPVAEPGYTVYSEVGYAVILLVMLIGVAILLRRLEITRYRALFYALFPFVPLGGALRVLEDANNVLGVADDPAAADAALFSLSYPLNTLLISPIIYFTMFFLTLAALLVALWLEREGYVEGYEYPLAGIGTAFLVGCLAVIAGLTFSTDVTVAGQPRLRFYPIITVLTLVIATASTAGVWGLLQTFAPQVNRGTGYIGLVIIWGQAIDGVSNVIGLDWYDELVPVASADLQPKHPVNKFVQDFTGRVLPESITSVTGDAFTFLLVKLVAAVFVVWVFDDEIFEESPRFTFMLLLAILAVGLGPGTRDMLRATFLV